MTACLICGQHALEKLFHIASLPVIQNAVWHNADKARAIARGQVTFMRCLYCGFVFNYDFRPELALYQQGYENNQAHSLIYQAHRNDRISQVLAAPGHNLLEVGCGQGHFLTALQYEAGEERFSEIVGFDPAFHNEIPLSANIQIYSSYFDDHQSDHFKDYFDIALSRHVIEHISDPLPFLRNIAGTLKPSGHLFIETPNIDWIIEHAAIWDFNYEHCSYFTIPALVFALHHVGLTLIEIKSIFAGQYLWAKACLTHVNNSDQPSTSISCKPSPHQSHHASSFKAALSTCQAIISANAKKKLALWGAGAKGVMLANLLDPQACLLTGVIDINPAKQNLFISGTGHPILAPEEIAAHDIQTIFVVNPIYLEEIQHFIAIHYPYIEIIPIPHKNFQGLFHSYNGRHSCVLSPS